MRPSGLRPMRRGGGMGRAALPRPNPTPRIAGERGGVGEGSVASAVPHSSDADAATQRRSSGAIEVCGFGTSGGPTGAQDFETFADADTFAENLPGDSG